MLDAGLEFHKCSSMPCVVAAPQKQLAGIRIPVPTGSSTDFCCNVIAAAYRTKPGQVCQLPEVLHGTWDLLPAAGHCADLQPSQHQLAGCWLTLRIR